MPCPGPFHFSCSVDYIYDFCPDTDPDVGLSIFVCDVEYTSFHLWSVRKFVMCLFGQYDGRQTQTIEIGRRLNSRLPKTDS